MRILKGCCSIILLILIVLVLTITLIISSVSSVAFSEKIPHEFIDSLNFKELAKKAVDDLNKKIEDSPEEPDNSNLNELEQGTLDVINTMTVDEEKQIKDSAKAIVSEIFDFLNTPGKEEMAFRVKEIKQIVFILAIRTGEFTKQTKLQKPICDYKLSEADQINCIKEEDLANIIDKSLTGGLTRADVEKAMPICKAGQDPQKSGCMSEADLNNLIKSSKEHADANQNSDKTDVQIFGNDEVTITKDQLPEELFKVRDILARSELVLPAGILISLLLMLVIYLLKKRAAIYYLVSALGIITILMFIPFILLKTQTDWIVSKLGEAPKFKDNLFFEEVQDLIHRYSNAFANAFLLRAIAVLFLFFLIISIVYTIRALRKRKAQ